MGSSGAPGTAVAGQAVRGGDIFESGGGGANALYRNETALGLAAAPTDELDDFEVDQQRRVQGTNDTLLAGVYDRPKQFFSLRSGSTFGIRSTAGAAITPSDILRFGTKGELEIAVAGTVLGLGAGDDLDALAIVDADSSNTLTGTDRIYYSLAAGSPALGANSPADVFCHTVAGATCGSLGGRLEITAAALGLLPGDEMDGLDIRAGTPSTGACCVSGGCSEVTASSCTSLGGSFSGPGTVCSSTACPSAPGACCSSNGTCSSLSDQACLTANGRFQGAGVSCGSVSCPSAGNDECSNAYSIPYDRPAYYLPPADNTYATYNNTSDPPYTCADHNVFFPPYGSGSIWYSYDVPPGSSPGRSISLDTCMTAPFYPYGGGAGDTRLAIYYSSSGNCSTLQEVACGDNSPGTYGPSTYYGAVSYTNPLPGRYYIQVSTVGDVNRGVIKLRVTDSPVPSVPSLGTWGFVALLLMLAATGWYLLRRRTWAAAGLFILCVAGLVFATGARWADNPAPPKQVSSAEDWPADSHLARNPEYPTLVMFANPDCTCTKTSLGELRGLMSRVASKARGYVVFTQDSRRKRDLSLSEAWNSASSIQGVKALSDQTAREAGLFGATTSGQVLLYDPKGELLFSGGIAPAMGQVGENPMVRALNDAIERVNAGRPKSAGVQMLNGVRGCSLRDSKK